MSGLFLKILNMSISASWLVLAVILLRFLLKKAPKWVNICLWGIVALRLICPFSIESAFSLIPSAETVSPEIMMDWSPTIDTGVPVLNAVVNPVITESFAPEPIASANPLQILIPVWALIWLLGILVLLLYTAISYWRLRRKVDTAVLLRENIFQSENVGSPFVLGIIRSRIYLPYEMKNDDMAHVIAHEQAHIRRRDHWWKPLGFLLLTIHWFNPLMWLAYILLCRDIELACDEKVIKELGSDARADYTQALVGCSVGRRMIAACPLAFGEVGVKQRVKSIMNYKKPAFWIVLAAVIVCIVVAVCFLTNPKSDVHVGVTYYYGTVTDQAMSVIHEGSRESREYISLHCDNGEDMLFWASESNPSAPVLMGKHVMVRARIEESSGLLVSTRIVLTDNTWADNREDAINNALLDFNWSSRYEGEEYFQCADFVLLSNEAGGPAEDNTIDTEIYYGLALHQVFTVQNGELVDVGGSHIPTVLTFAIDESGKYILTEYWQPRDGSYYTSDIKEKFPAFVWPDTQKYIDVQEQRNIAKAEEYFGLTGTTEEGYEHDGVTYRHKLELTGKFPNSDVETTFVVLTNREDLTFDMVANALVSSNLEDSKILEDTVIISEDSESVSTEAASDLAYFMELSAQKKVFQNMTDGKRSEILSEYGDLLADFSIVAREASDGSASYIVGHFSGDIDDNPLAKMSCYFTDDEEGAIFVLYPEGEREAVEVAIASNQVPDNGYILRSSYINYAPETGLILILPMDSTWGFEKVFNKYLTANGRAYMTDAVARGIALTTPEGPYLVVTLISEKWGEVSEKIPLTQEQVNQILSKPRQKLEEGFGFMARLELGTNSTIAIDIASDELWFTEFRGVPQTVLDLATEKCGYQFASPKDITGTIVEATLECPWLDAALSAKESDLQTLQAILTNAEFGYIGSCGYRAKLTITLSDGTQRIMFKGTDDCDSLVFGSYGGYFIGDQENKVFWEMFGLDPDTKELLE